MAAGGGDRDEGGAVETAGAWKDGTAYGGGISNVVPAVAGCR